MLAQKEIIKEIEQNNLEISPFEPIDLEKFGYSLHLSETIEIFSGNGFEEIKLNIEGTKLEKEKIYFGKIKETIKSRSLIPVLNLNQKYRSENLIIMFEPWLKNNFRETIGFVLMAKKETKIFVNEPIGRIHFFCPNTINGHPNKPVNIDWSCSD